MTRLDFSQPPFDVLTPAERESLKTHTQVRYLAKGDILSPDEHIYFYVVLKGSIQQQLAGKYVSDFQASNFSNDWFDARLTPEDQAIENESTKDKTTDAPCKNNKSQLLYQYTAVEDTLLLQVEAQAIDHLSAQNRHIRNLLSGNLQERLQALKYRTSQGHSLAGITQKNATYPSSDNTVPPRSGRVETEQLMLQPVTAIPLLPAHIIAHSASLFEAAKIMTNAGLKHVLIQRTRSADRHPTRAYDTDLGILSDTDICRAMSDDVDAKLTPCHKYAMFKLRTITPHHDVSEALLAMIRYRVHRLPVVDIGGDIIGVLGQSDLLSFLSHHSQLITAQIEQAEDFDSLTIAVERIGEYIREQHQNGIKVNVISRMVQTLNAQVFTKLWHIIVPKMVFENTCVIVMGSEGRGEQIMRTDQDNALIIRNGFRHPDLPKFTEAFNQQLSKMGYPLCDGNIMMTNSLWCQPLNRFKSQVTSWFAGHETEQSIWLSAVLDASFVCGDERLLTSLQEHLKVAHRNTDPMFIRTFARAALQFGDTNQWWQKFAPLIRKPMPQDIDLKKAGIFPLVHGIRTMALEYGIIEQTNTKLRLTALMQAGVFNEKRCQDLNGALEFFMAQRLAVALKTEDKHARQVDPNTLSALERDLLKECLNIVKSFKNELRQHYQLEI